MNKSEYLSIMDFINSRKHQKDNEAANELRRKKYKENLALIILMHNLGFFIIVTFFTFPLIELAFNETYRFAQPLYIPIDFASNSPIVYGICYVFTCFAAHNSGISVVANLMLFYSASEYLSTEFEILGNSFEEALEQENVVENYKKLIKHHQDILR